MIKHSVSKLDTHLKIIYLLFAKTKNQVDKNSIHLNELYWRSLQIRFTSNDLTSSVITQLPFSELKYNMSVKPFLHNIKITNNTIIDGYPEFGLIIIDKKISKIDNLYEALKTQNCLIHFNTLPS